MPKKLEEKLRREAKKKGLTGERADAYVYGTMQKTTDWKPHRRARKGSKRR
jgi:hypothetical protein